MLKKIKHAIIEHRLWTKGEPLLVGVSSGPDSVSLLDALAPLRAEFGPLTVCHLNHQLRGAASDVDAEFVRSLAKRYDLPLEIRSRDVKQLAAEQKISIEMAARRARLEFFSELTRATGTRKIALAHTADDQAETVLLRLIRGAGREGLSAMESLTFQRASLILIRPMLDVWRAEVLAYLQERKLDSREDATNQDETFLRNRIRHKLLPLLEAEFNPAVKSVLKRTAEIMSEEEAFLHVIAKDQLRMCGDDEHLRVADLSILDISVQRRVVRLWLARWMPLGELTFERVEAVLRLAAESAGTANVDIGRGLVVVREYDILKFQQTRETQTLAADVTFNVEVVERRAWEAAMKTGLGAESLTAFFDADVFGATQWSVHYWREGDRFQPLGMSEEKKLQDFFVDEKVPQLKRAQVPLVTCGERIAWVVGYRIADWAKVTEKTKRATKITAVKEKQE